MSSPAITSIFASLAALLIVLVQRYFETAGKRYLSMGARA